MPAGALAEVGEVRVTLLGDLTRPENCAELRDRRRLLRALTDRGGCWACVHRNPEVMAWGRSVCKANAKRAFPLCTSDGQAPAFEADWDQVRKELAR